MSIALSVPIVQSRLLQTMILAYAGVCIGMGAACLAGALGPMAWQGGIGALCMLAGLALLRRARARSNVRRIDVTGLAGLALTVQLEGGDETAVHRIPVRLAAGSTLWPGLLVLRLRGPPATTLGRGVDLVLLPDSVAPGEFRGLLVALRAVAGRAVVTVEEIPEIL